MKNDAESAPRDPRPPLPLAIPSPKPFYFTESLHTGSSPRAQRKLTRFISATTQRNLNNAFAYDLVPSPSVLVAALKAARRVNDYPTAVRIFEGVKAKVENKQQYQEYLEELKPLREELGVALKEDLYPEEAK